MFERMLADPKIEVRLKTDYREARSQVRYKRLIYTGPLDEYFDHCFGPLPYRSLRFEAETLEQEFFQPAMQVNYPNDYDFTRIIEIKHATGQRLPPRPLSANIRPITAPARSVLSRSCARCAPPSINAMPSALLPKPESVSSGGLRPIAITTWTRLWAWPSRV